MTINREQFLSKLDHLNLIFICSTEPSWHTPSQMPIQLIHLIFHVYLLINSKVNAQKTKQKCLELLKFYSKY